VLAVLDRIVPILAFLLCITVVAELSDRIGVFAVIADRAARLARGSVWRLWALVALVAVVATAVPSLDTTAVLLTPVVLALARQLRLDAAVFAYTTVWLANTASLVLPVSNLTNLLAAPLLGGGPPRFVALVWPAALTSIVVTVVALALLFRRSLRGRYDRVPPEEPHDRPLLVLATVVCLLLGPAFALGVDVTAASAVGALVLVVACAIRAPSRLSLRLVPWLLLLGVAVLFVVIQLLHERGLGSLLSAAAGHDGGFVGLLRTAGVAAGSANLVNNLPAYLALEPVVAGDPAHLAALLLGVNAGPLITPWASLATLLWAGRCRAAGVRVDWRTFALRGLLLVPVLLVASTAALWLC
jgi:arsenical pump membrane protein